MFLKGLCGTFNENQRDDFTTPEGDVETSVPSFANQWKTDEVCQDVEDKEVPHPCKSNSHNKAAAEKYCAKIKDAIFNGNSMRQLPSAGCSHALTFYFTRLLFIMCYYVLIIVSKGGVQITVGNYAVIMVMIT